MLSGWLLCSILVSPRTGFAEKSPTPVNVVNTPTVSVQQSGKWVVGLNDTPTVKVSSQSGALRSPMTFDVQTPYLKTVSFNIENGTSQNNAPIAIPEGKRLIIEHISARAQGPMGQKFIAQIQTNVTGSESPRGIYWMVFAFQGTFSTIDVFTASQLMRVYADAGKTPVLFVATRTSINGTAFVEATISGYLVNIH